MTDIPALQLEHNIRLARVAADDVNPPNDPIVSERHNILFTDTRDAHSLYDNQHVLSPPLIHISAQASQSDFLKRDVIDSSRFGIQQQMTIPSIPSERDTALSHFWTSLKTIESVDHALRLPVVTFISECPRVLFVRQAYQSMFTLISNRVKKGISDNDPFGTSGYAITGNPGTGKCVFLFYILWRLSTLPNVTTVVLHRAKDDPSVYVFRENNCFITTDTLQLHFILQSPDTWHLTDTLPRGPSAVSAVTIVVASPTRDYYKQFLKYRKTSPLMYMPIWTLDELILACPLYCITKEVVEARFEKIGGIPRYIFEKHTLITKVIEEAVGRLNFNMFTAIVNRTLIEEDEIGHLSEPDYPF